MAELTKEQELIMDYAVYFIEATIEDKGILSMEEWMLYTERES